MKVWLPITIICALAAVSGFTVTDVKDQVHPKGRYSGLDAHETHASASLLGQFRTNISGWLWVRADLYLHNGVTMRPLSEQELLNGRKGVGSSDNADNQLHDDSKVVTVIPSAERDFRGVFGDLDRATKAYQDMTGHSHNNPKQSLPLFRLMTWLDPNFIPGWTTGAAVLAMGKDRNSYFEAVKLLNEGLEKNPDSISILDQLGFTYIARVRDLASAEKVLERAQATGKRYDLQDIPEDERESLLSAYRWLALVYRQYGKLDLQYAVMREGLELFPGDAVLERMLNAPPLVLAPQKERQEEVRPEEPDHSHDHDHDHSHPH